MITKFPLLIIGHPFLSFFVIVCIGLGISRWVQLRAGHDGLIRAKRMCLVCFYTCLLFIILDGAIAMYARTLNPEGYALSYPIAAALILFPVAATAGILVIIFRLLLRRA